MQNIGEVIDTSKLGCRDIHVDTALSQLKANINKYRCWGATRYVVDKLVKKWGTCKWFKFFVTGMNHKGWVYIELNGADLYDIYYCNNRNKIVMVDNDIYGDMICDVIDGKIEKQENYKF